MPDVDSNGMLQLRETQKVYQPALPSDALPRVLEVEKKTLVVLLEVNN